MILELKKTQKAAPLFSSAITQIKGNILLRAKKHFNPEGIQQILTADEIGGYEREDISTMKWLNNPQL